MSSTVSNPGLILGGGTSGNPAGLGNPGQLETAYQNLLSNAAGMISDTGAKVLNLTAGAIGTAGTIQIGNTETAAEVANNRFVLQEISDFCSANNIKINVQAVLTNGATYGTGPTAINALVDQWATAAAAVNLPIASIEDVQEIGITSQADDLAKIAAIEVNAVQTLITDYAASNYKLTPANLAVGDMEGEVSSGSATISQWWDAYNSAASSAGLANFSFVTTDTGWFAPWIDVESIPSWQAALTSMSTLAASYKMAMNVTIQGAETDTSANQFVQQAEQCAVGLAALQATGGIDVDNITIQTWDSLPVGVSEISSPTSSTNEAAEIRAVYPLYLAGSISAQGSFHVTAPGQLILNTGNTTSGIALSIQWNASDLQAGTRAGVVIIDQTGTLSASQSGSGTASSLASNILVLTGNFADLTAELNSIRVSETNAGADTIDIEVYGATGRLSDTQINVLAAAPGQDISAINASSNGQGWSTASAILNTGTVITAGSVMTSETLYWNTTGTLTSVETHGQPAFIKTVAIHQPLAEYGVKTVSCAVLGTTTDAVVDLYDPHVDNGAFPSNGYANNLGVNNVSLSSLPGWLGNSFNPASQLTPLKVQSTTKTFDPESGLLSKSVDVLAPDPLTTVDFTGTHSNRFATAFDNGGTQVTEYNTGHNEEWQVGWGGQFSSAVLTYDGAGQLVEEFLQGGPDNPQVTIDYVFNPNNGRLWEVFQSTEPPAMAQDTKNYAATNNPYQPGFATGPLYVTEFNTGDNPNWDYLDWGNSISSDTEVWTDYYIVGNSAGFAVSSSGQNTGALNAYPYQFVNGSALDLMNLPGSIDINLNSLGTIEINSQTINSGLSGIETINAAGATGAVAITGLESGGSTLIGGDQTSTITGFGDDTVVAGAGFTTIATGRGGSTIGISSANSIVTIGGDGNTISAVAGSTLIFTGTANKLNNEIVAAGTIVVGTGNAGDLSNLNGGTFNLGDLASAARTGNHISAWMNASGGALTLTGDYNHVTGGDNASITLTGDNNVANTLSGGVISVSGQSNVVVGTNMTVSTATGLTVVNGDKNTVTAITGSTITIRGAGDTVTATGATLNLNRAASSATINGDGNVVWLDADGGTLTAHGNNNRVTGGYNAAITLVGDNNVAGVWSGATISVSGENNIVDGTNMSVSTATGLTAVAVNGDKNILSAAPKATATINGDGNVVWLDADGGALTAHGNNNRVTGGYNAAITLVGDNNVAGVWSGATISVSGENNIVDGTNMSVSTATESTAVAVVGDNNTVTATSGGIVTVKGVGDTVTGATGSLTVLATSAYAGVAVTGGSGGATLEITSGGTVSLNDADTNLIVKLDASTNLRLGNLSFITAIGAAAGHDTIVAGAQNQTLQSTGGSDTLVGWSSFGDTFSGTVAGLAADTIKNFGGSDIIDITDLSFASLKPLSFDSTSGILAVADATQSVTIALAGVYTSANFTASDNGHGGVQIAFAGH